MSQVVLNPGPYALSLSGGGSKGAYTVGVIKYIWEVLQARDIRIVVGTSTGALIAAKLGVTLATGDPVHLMELEKIYRSVTTGNILQPNQAIAHSLAGEEGGLLYAILTDGDAAYSSKPLDILLKKFITPAAWKKVIAANDRLTIGFSVVDIEAGKQKLVTNVSHPDHTYLHRALVASASMPFLMPPVKLPGEDGRFVDGGIIDYNPVERIPELSDLRGIQQILAVNLEKAEDDRVVKVKTVMDILVRLLDVLSHQVGVEDIQNAEAKTGIPISLVEPKEHIEMDSLTFEQPAMSDLVDRGFRDAADLISLAPSV